MREVELVFQGYTWDDYFYVISNKAGIFIAYRGGLDKEGTIKMNEVIYVDEADELYAIYESKSFADIRNKLGREDRLFFSYAEMSKVNRAEIAKSLRDCLMPTNSVKRELSELKLSCKGACALFPIDIL